MSQFQPLISGQFITRNGPSRSDQRKFRTKLKSKLHAKPELEFSSLYDQTKKDSFQTEFCDYTENSGICKETERWAYYRFLNATGPCAVDKQSDLSSTDLSVEDVNKIENSPIEDIKTEETLQNMVSLESENHDLQEIPNEFYIGAGIGLDDEGIQEVSIEPEMEPEDENFFLSNSSNTKLQIKNKLMSKIKQKRAGNQLKLGDCKNWEIGNRNLKLGAEFVQAKKSRIEFLNDLREQQNRVIKEQAIRLQEDRRQKRREDREKRKNKKDLKNSELLPPQSKGLSYSDATVSKCSLKSYYIAYITKDMQHIICCCLNQTY